MQKNYDNLDLSPSLKNCLKSHKNGINCLVWSKDGNKLLSCSNDLSIIFWDLVNQTDLKKSYRLTGHCDIVHAVDIASNSSYLTSCSRDKSVRLWKIKDGRPDTEPIVYKCHCNTIRFVNISPSSDYFCTASDDKSIKIWSPFSKNKQINLLKGHTNWIRCCKYCPFDANLIASCGDDPFVLIHDTREYSSPVINLLSKRGSKSNFLGWYPKNQNLLALASHDSTIRIFDLRSQKLLQYYNAHNGHVNSVDFHPSGNYLISSSDDGCSKIFDLLEGRILFTLRAHVGAVVSSTFTSNGNFFATSGLDNIINIWKSNLIDDSERCLDLIGIDNVSPFFASSSPSSLSPSQSPTPASIKEDKTRQKLSNLKKKNQSSLSINDITKLDQTKEKISSHNLNEHSNASKLKKKDKIFLTLLNQIDSITESISILEKRITNLETNQALINQK